MQFIYLEYQGAITEKQRCKITQSKKDQAVLPIEGFNLEASENATIIQQCILRTLGRSPGYVFNFLESLNRKLRLNEYKDYRY